MHGYHQFNLNPRRPSRYVVLAWWCVHRRILPPRSCELEHALDDGDVLEAAYYEEGGEEKDNEHNDGEAPVSVVVDARRADLVARPNGLLDVLEAQ